MFTIEKALLNDYSLANNFFQFVCRKWSCRGRLPRIFFFLLRIYDKMRDNVGVYFGFRLRQPITSLLLLSNPINGYTNFTVKKKSLLVRKPFWMNLTSRKMIQWFLSMRGRRRTASILIRVYHPWYPRLLNRDERKYLRSEFSRHTLVYEEKLHLSHDLLSLNDTLFLMLNKLCGSSVFNLGKCNNLYETKMIFLRGFSLCVFHLTCKNRRNLQ